MEAVELKSTARSCPDVLDCLVEDHESMREVVSRLQSPGLETNRKRVIFKRFLPLYESHTHAEEVSVMEAGLQHEGLRPLAMKALEQHEVADLLVERMRLAVDNEQWEARLHLFCSLITQHMDEEELVTFPQMRRNFSADEREHLGRRYLDSRNHHRVLPTLQMAASNGVALDQAGRVGYFVAWLLGVPAWILLLVFLIRG